MSSWLRLSRHFCGLKTAAWLSNYFFQYWIHYSPNWIVGRPSQGRCDKGFHRFRFRLFAPERDDGPRRQRGAQLQEFQARPGRAAHATRHEGKFLSGREGGDQAGPAVVLVADARLAANGREQLFDTLPVKNHGISQVRQVRA
jgi:hypothetical protein